MPLTANGAAVPVETLLKLTLDKTGSQGIQDFLDQHERLWTRIEQAVTRVSQGVEGLGRKALGLAGVAGVAGVVSNLMQVSQAGSKAPM